MSELHTRPDWVRRLNKFGPAVGGAEHIVPLAPDELLALAQESTGLTATGALSDDAWLESYRRRLAAIDRDSSAHLLGRLLARAEALRVLQTRLRLEHAWQRTPEMLDEPISRPIFVVGAPRTGTSILLELLALDSGLRAPISWQSHHPLPHGDTDDREWRYGLAEAEQELWADIQPELMTLHELRSDLPCECVHFMALDFAAGYWGMQYLTPSYDAWAAEHPELTARTYRAHRRFLQTLQHADGGAARPWLLKTPGHLATMEALFAEYPDALIVHTHRDPLKFVASAASTTAMLRWLRSDAVDPIVQGQLAEFGFGFMLNSVREGRSSGALPDAQFFDSHYQQLMADPAAAMRRIYDHFSLPWPAGHEKVIRGYLRDKPKHKFGKHEYRFEDYGLEPESIRKTYGDYVAHYGIEAED